jgi:dTDP-4-dehydrorhamnose reductase
LRTSPILLFGANGQLGFELQRSLSVVAPVVALDHAKCDVADPLAVGRAIDETRPAFIVNAAAYTAVDKAEQAFELAQSVNAQAPEVMASHGARVGARLIHFSTDYVFDGSATGPYLETDRPNPQSVYGTTKLQGEVAVLAANAGHMVLRTSWVAGAHGSNFAKTIMRLARERDNLRIVSDQIGAPTTAAMLADVTAQILTKDLAREGAGGLYHVTASGSTSWYGYARHIVEWCEQRGISLKTASSAIQPITTEDYPLPAKRPKNSRLDTARIRTAFDLTLPAWQQSLDLLLEQLVQE